MTTLTILETLLLVCLQYPTTKPNYADMVDHCAYEAYKCHQAETLCDDKIRKLTASGVAKKTDKGMLLEVTDELKKSKTFERFGGLRL